MEGFGVWKRRGRYNIGGLEQIFVTLQTELEGLIYRQKGGEKGGKMGGKTIQVSPQKAKPSDIRPRGKQNSLLGHTWGGVYGWLAKKGKKVISPARWPACYFQDKKNGLPERKVAGG